MQIVTQGRGNDKLQATLREVFQAFGWVDIPKGVPVCIVSTEEVITMNEQVDVTESCGCVGCDLELPVVDGKHGTGTEHEFPCTLPEQK